MVSYNSRNAAAPSFMTAVCAAMAGAAAAFSGVSPFVKGSHLRRSNKYAAAPAADSYSVIPGLSASSASAAPAAHRQKATACMIRGLRRSSDAPSAPQPQTAAISNPGDGSAKSAHSPTPAPSAAAQVGDDAAPHKSASHAATTPPGEKPSIRTAERAAAPADRIASSFSRGSVRSSPMAKATAAAMADEAAHSAHWEAVRPNK